MINKAYECHIYPNNAQTTLLHKTICCSRIVCNRFPFL
ncbi:helix-turn-helix domain-containing protein [Bacillus toyonensis]